MSPLPQVVVSTPRDGPGDAPPPGGTAIRARTCGVVGITGTDGKTTTSFLAVAALEAAGHPDRADRHRRHPDRRHPGTKRGARDHPGGARAAGRAPGDGLAGDEAAVIETTSHGLALGRVGSIAYDVAILTNLTHEHLELHGTWEAYRDAKLSLFERLAGAPARPATAQALAEDRDRQPRRPVRRARSSA